MSTTKDYGIRDLGRIVLTLRKDLTFTPQELDGKGGYLIEDPVRTKFHRVGIAEYQFMSLLDGKTSISDALHTTAATLSDQAFTQTEAAAICKWLVDSGLAHTPESSQAGRLLESARELEQASLLRQLNPMYIRVPLAQPDRFLDALAPSLGWIHGPIGWALASVLAVVASSQLLIHWDRFVATTDTIFSPNRWLWLGLCWIVLKVVHETSHGLVCKRYGGSVREFGIIFVLFAPLAFVDVTSSWRFSSKWHRIHTALAGMYIEFLCASLAAIVWSQTGPGPLNDAAFNLIAMASITTVVFNANPLMRFDGYYVLSDFLELPNLYSNGQQFVNYLGRRYLVGIATQPPRWTSGKKDTIIRFYGVAALLWRAMVSVTLVIAATTMFAGAGVILSVLATCLWLGMPLWRFVKYLAQDPALTHRHRLGFVSRLATVLALATVLLAFAPWPGVVWAPAIIEYSPRVIVRASSPGFVAAIRVSPGDSVEAGDVLVALENDELRRELADLALEMRSAMLLSRAHENNQRMADHQAELERYSSLQKQYGQKQAEVDGLTVRAPASGQVIGRDLAALSGTYLRQGNEIVAIGNQRSKEVQISVAQEDVEVFVKRLQKPISIRVAGTSRFSSFLKSVSPRASLQPLHPALCAPNGGPLAVKESNEEQSTLGKESVSYEVLAPRFRAIVSLSEDQSIPLRAGQIGVATFHDKEKTVGQYLYQSISRWLRRKFSQASSTS